MYKLGFIDWKVILIISQKIANTFVKLDLKSLLQMEIQKEKPLKRLEGNLISL